MPSQNKTPNYDLTQYADNGTDKISVMGDYNQDMSKIDTAMNTNAKLATNANNTAHTAIDKATTNAANIAKNASAITQNSAHITALGDELRPKISANATAIAKNATTIAKNAGSITAAINSAKSDNTALHNTVTTETANKIATELKPYLKTADANNTFAKIGLYVARKNRKILCIGDSWGRGWHNGASHDDESPYKVMGDVMNSFYKSGSSAEGWTGVELINKSVNASGLVPNGDSHNFIGQYNDYPGLKSDIDDICILGGQNDASAKVSWQDTVNAVNALCAQMRKYSPHAHVWVFLMPLAPGQRIGNWGANGNVISPRSTVLDAASNTYRGHMGVTVVDGVYRWGDMLESIHPGGVDAGDGTHTTKLGYDALGRIMANVLFTGQSSQWPSFTGSSSNSSILGKWDNVLYVEQGGVIELTAVVRGTNMAPKEGGLFLTLPLWARPGLTRYVADMVNTNPQHMPTFYSIGSNGNINVYNAPTSSGVMVLQATYAAGV